MTLEPLGRYFSQSVVGAHADALMMPTRTLTGSVAAPELEPEVESESLLQPAAASTVTALNAAAS